MGVSENSSVAMAEWYVTHFAAITHAVINVFYVLLQCVANFLPICLTFLAMLPAVPQSFTATGTILQNLGENLFMLEKFPAI